MFKTLIAALLVAGFATAASAAPKHSYIERASQTVDYGGN